LRSVSVNGAVQQEYYYDTDNDPDGNLDCVTTAAGTAADCPAPDGGTVSANLLQSYSYDYLNRLVGYESFGTGGGDSSRSELR